MKKLVYIFITSLLLTACITYRTLNLNRLTTGMTKAEVEYVAGAPYRVLAVSQTRGGYQEVLEYRTSNGEIYALEFWNDYLVGYEYIDETITYVPAPVPPAYYPPYGSSVVVIRPRPNHPHYRPIPSPAYRPPANNANRPSQPSRPSSPAAPSRPSNSNSSSTPSYGGGRSSNNSTPSRSSGSSSNASSSSRTPSTGRASGSDSNGSTPSNNRSSSSRSGSSESNSSSSGRSR
ncbi:MAG: hypothetical protein LBH58_10915 [Tannerellaceae bacterium]|nr:hypothetical protein [Tannerellaceae bacterium]